MNKYKILVVLVLLFSGNTYSWGCESTNSIPDREISSPSGYLNKAIGLARGRELHNSVALEDISINKINDKSIDDILEKASFFHEQTFADFQASNKPSTEFQTDRLKGKILQLKLYKQKEFYINSARKSLQVNQIFWTYLSSSLEHLATIDKSHWGNVKYIEYVQDLLNEVLDARNIALIELDNAGKFNNSSYYCAEELFLCEEIHNRLEEFCNLSGLKGLTFLISKNAEHVEHKPVGNSIGEVLGNKISLRKLPNQEQNDLFIKFQDNRSVYNLSYNLVKPTGIKGETLDQESMGFVLQYVKTMENYSLNIREVFKKWLAAKAPQVIKSPKHGSQPNNAPSGFEVTFAPKKKNNPVKKGRKNKSSNNGKKTFNQRQETKSQQSSSSIKKTPKDESLEDLYLDTLLKPQLSAAEKKSPLKKKEDKTVTKQTPVKSTIQPILPTYTVILGDIIPLGVEISELEFYLDFFYSSQQHTSKWQDIQGPLDKLNWKTEDTKGGGSACLLYFPTWLQKYITLHREQNGVKEMRLLVDHFSIHRPHGKEIRFPNSYFKAGLERCLLTKERLQAWISAMKGK